MAATSLAIISQSEIQQPFSVVVAHSFILVGAGLARICESLSKYRVVGQFSHASEVLRFIEAHRPDIAIVDMGLTDLSPLLVVRHVKTTNLPTKIILLANDQRTRSVADALHSGASGYLSRSSGAREMLVALELASQGSVFFPPEVDLKKLARAADDDPLTRLSPRESEVFTFLIHGVRVKEIAARLALSANTVDTHRSGLMRKLDIHNVPGLVKFAIRRGLLGDQ